MPHYTTIVTLLAVAFFLSCDSRRGGAWQVRHSTPGNDRKSQLRAQLPRACEHA
jgi:hypothetical protein